MDINLSLPQPHPAQQQVLDQAKRFNVVACGRRFGKTFLAVILAAIALIAGKPVGWFAPTYKNLEDTWRQLKETLRPLIRKINEQEHRIECYTGGTLDMWSLDSPDTARGRKYALVIVDEAASVANLLDVWRYVLRPMLIDLRGAAWFLSTPKKRNGFYKLHLIGRDPENAEWMSWTFPSWANTKIDRSEIDALRADLSEEAWRQEILAEFLEDEGTVFRNLAAAMTAIPNDTPENHTGHILVAGLDWGKVNDFTANSIGCATCRREVQLDRFNIIDYAFQYSKVEAAWNKWHITLATCELNSIGIPNFEQMQRRSLPVIGFDTTASSKGPLIEGLVLDLEQSRLSLINEPASRAELEAYEAKVNPNTNRVTYSAPEEMRDDTVIARALMDKTMNQYAYVRRKAKQSSSPLKELV